MSSINLTDISLQNLKEERVKIASALSSLDQAIRILEGSQEKPIDWKNNALNCIKSNDIPMRTIEILNCLFYDEHEKLTDEAKRRNYISALSIALNNLCDKGLLDRSAVNGNKGFYYGLNEWYSKPNVLNIQYQKKLSDALWGKEAKETIF